MLQDGVSPHSISGPDPTHCSAPPTHMSPVLGLPGLLHPPRHTLHSNPPHESPQPWAHSLGPASQPVGSPNLALASCPARSHCFGPSCFITPCSTYLFHRSPFWKNAQPVQCVAVLQRSPCAILKEGAFMVISQKSIIKIVYKTAFDMGILDQCGRLGAQCYCGPLLRLVPASS